MGEFCQNSWFFYLLTEDDDCMLIKDNYICITGIGEEDCAKVDDKWIIILNLWWWKIMKIYDQQKNWNSDHDYSRV